MLHENLIINDTYRIIRPIGKGGTGIIYLAEHLHLRKMVVLKKIKTSLQNSVAVRQEADILKSLHHMYLPQVYDFFQYDSQVFTVIDYIEGNDLQYYIDGGVVFPENQIIKWMRQMCDALDYLHSHNPPVYHNDIKPANIIINSDGNICLIDFNISTDASDIVYGFTAEYASPEQYGKVLSITDPAYVGNAPLVGAQSDLYSLGATIYRLASGCPTSVYAVVNNSQPFFSQVAVGFSDGFCAIIDTLMNPDPGSRFQTAEELKKALGALKRQDVRFRRYWSLSVISLLLSGLMIVGGIWAVYKGQSELKIRAFDSEYAELCTVYENEAYSESVNIGTEILAHSDWKSIVTLEKKAKINYIIGMSYYRSEQYSASEEYLKKAIETESEPSVRCGYEMDMAIVFAYWGKLDSAGEMLEKASADGLDRSRIALVNAQICYTSGQYDETLSIYSQTVSEANIPQDTYMRLNELAGDAYIAKKDYANAIFLYEYLYGKQQGISICRKLAASYVMQSQQTGISTGEKAELLEKALNCYTTLTANEYHSSVDLINYGKIYRLLGTSRDYEPYYTASIKILEDASEEFPDDYRVYVQLAFSYDKAGNKEKAVENCLIADSKYGSSSHEMIDDDMLLFCELKTKLGL